MQFEVFFLIFSALLIFVKSLKAGECEGMYLLVFCKTKTAKLSILVCIKTLNKFAATLTDEQKKKPAEIEKQFKIFCKTSKNKENRFVSIYF